MGPMNGGPINLASARLRRASLRFATLSGANLEGADLSGADLTDARLDGVNLGAEDTSSPYSVSWNTATASIGTHTLTARARDAAGNTTTSATITVTVPDEYMGDVIGDLNSRRGKVLGAEPKGTGQQVIRAHVPMSEVLRYAPDLRSMTSGRGDFELEFEWKIGEGGNSGLFYRGTRECPRCGHVHPGAAA